MRWSGLGLAALAGLAGGCKGTGDGRVVIQRPGEVRITTRSDTLHLPEVSLPRIHVGQKVDTVTVPTVVGKKTTVKHPTIRITRP